MHQPVASEGAAERPPTSGAGQSNEPVPRPGAAARRSSVDAAGCTSLVYPGMEVISTDDHFVGVVLSIQPDGLFVDTGRLSDPGLPVGCDEVRAIDDDCVVLRRAYPAL